MQWDFQAGIIFQHFITSWLNISFIFYYFLKLEKNGNWLFNIAYFIFRNWQENLKRLQRPEISMSIRPPTSSDLALLNSLPRTQISLSVRPTAALCAGNGDNKSSGLEMKPEVSIKPAFKLEDESGVLNLSKGSETGWSPPPASPDTMRPSPPRSPQGYRPPSYTSVEICVVCGDRASGIILKIF